MLETKDIIKYLSDNKQYFGEKYFVDKIAIIGSYARGDYNKDSDVDLVVYFQPNAMKNRIFRLYVNLFGCDFETIGQKGGFCG